MPTVAGTRCWAARAAVCAAALSAVQQSRGAGITFDLRFIDGSHTKVAVAGNTYTLELWARVSGTNGNNLDDGIGSSLHTLMSAQVGGGAITAGGFSSGAVDPNFQYFSGTMPIHRAGGSSDLNADGIIDWGSTSTNGANSNYFYARAPNVLTGPGFGQAVDADTWEFRLGTFTVNAAATGAGVTRFDVVKPPTAVDVSSFTYVVGRVDNTTFNVTDRTQQGAYTNSIGVSFIPEPASVALLGVAGISLLRNRRRT
jgi:hypothetical protein